MTVEGSERKKDASVLVHFCDVFLFGQIGSPCRCVPFWANRQPLLLSTLCVAALRIAYCTHLTSTDSTLTDWKDG